MFWGLQVAAGGVGHLGKPHPLVMMGWTTTHTCRTLFEPVHMVFNNSV